MEKLIIIIVVTGLIAGAVSYLIGKKHPKKELQLKMPYVTLRNKNNTFILSKQAVVVLYQIIDIKGTIKDLFDSLGGSFNIISLTQKQLDENESFLLSLSDGAFTALIREKENYSVYYKQKNQEAQKLQLTDFVPTHFSNIYLVARRG